jgi:hypothetical protein
VEGIGAGLVGSEAHGRRLVGGRVFARRAGRVERLEPSYVSEDVRQLALQLGHRGVVDRQLGEGREASDLLQRDRGAYSQSRSRPA